MNLIKLLICLIIIFFSTTVSAEFYKYVDENGNTCFTDDFNKVPEDQRTDLKGYEESKIDSDTGTVENKVIKENNVSDKENQKDLAKFHDRLNNTRLQLVKEHEEIKKEREQNTKNKKNAKTQRDILKINKKTNELNKKQEELKKKIEVFEAEKDEYNKKLEEAEAKEK